MARTGAGGRWVRQRASPSSPTADVRFRGVIHDDFIEERNPARVTDALVDALNFGRLSSQGLGRRLEREAERIVEIVRPDGVAFEYEVMG